MVIKSQLAWFSLKLWFLCGGILVFCVIINTVIYSQAPHPHIKSFLTITVIFFVFPNHLHRHRHRHRHLWKKESHVYHSWSGHQVQRWESQAAIFVLLLLINMLAPFITLIVYLSCNFLASLFMTMEFSYSLTWSLFFFFLSQIHFWFLFMSLLDQPHFFVFI